MVGVVVEEVIMELVLAVLDRKEVMERQAQMVAHFRILVVVVVLVEME